MRVYGVVQHLWRETEAPTSVEDAAGERHTIPPDTACMLNFAACHRNPTYWTPADEPATRRAELAHSPAINFQPERFLGVPSGRQSGKAQQKRASKSTHAVPEFFPFGQGWRQCPGERFAAVEMTAVFATVYKTHSVELVVEPETLAMCKGDADKAWRATRDDAIRTLWSEARASIKAEMTGERHLRMKVTPRDQTA